jgi:signal peptidase I
MKDFLTDVLKTILLAAIIVIPIRTFVFQPFLVRGASMEPNYYQGDYLIVDQFSYLFQEPQRGEVIVFDPPTSTNKRFIKRIIGLPGETVSIEDGDIYIEKEGERWFLDEYSYLEVDTDGRLRVEIPENNYFVLGDNRASSLDSRSWGVLPKKNIIGKVALQISPATTLANLKSAQ